MHVTMRKCINKPVNRYCPLKFTNELYVVKCKTSILFMCQDDLHVDSECVVGHCQIIVENHARPMVYPPTTAIDRIVRKNTL